MRVLVFGRTGQVATELARRAPAGWHLDCLGRDRADLADPEACAAIVAAAQADAVINAAAYTAVDRAETETALAHTVNAAAPGAMARAAAARGLPLIHISTDYVFDGTGRTPWSESDPVAPQNAYGRSKLAGEVALRAAHGPHAILRTSWVFSAHGGNVVKTMLRLGRTRDQLRVVDDQTGGPTPAAAIAEAALTIARAFHEGRGVTGTFHFAGAPDTTWAGFAREILARAGIATPVTGIPTAEFPTPARRPANSRLNYGAILRAYGIARPDWRAGLDTVLAELAEQESGG